MTPQSIDENVSRLLQQIDSKSTPVYLDVRPEPDAKVLQCFASVEKKVKRNGGKAVYGWQIWQTNLLVEAEFHAVWQSPNNTLVDITPKQIFPIHQILFVPDPTKSYTGASIDNIRLNITNNPLVDEFIAISESIFLFLNKGERTHEDIITLDVQEASIYKTLEDIKAGVMLMINQGATSKNVKCYCGSHSKYKHCHGKTALKITGQLKSQYEAASL